ncbi:MAG: protein kinase [Chloroflexi bacterium]|nr:protein kinase [Chloroflexota bacterium]
MLTQNRTDLSGQQIGNYDLEEWLVSRSVSDFYLGSDVKLDQPVFVEILRATAEQDPDLAGQFQRRMEAVSQIKHPHIASVMDIGVNPDGYPYAVIEYIPGTWLDERLAEWHADGYLPPIEDALLLVRQIADALSVAHPAGLVDPDLRPNNILIRDSDSTPVLVDLGVPIAANQRDAALINKQSNSLDYASPEEIEGKAIGRRSNIYSLGILLYELLTGHRPRLPTSSWDIFERSTMPKEVPLEEERQGLSGETYRLVRNCLWRREWSRYESADELMSAIDTAILAEQTLPKTTITGGRGRRWLYVAVPIVALLILIFGLAFAWGQLVNAEQGQSTATPSNIADNTSQGALGGVVGSANTPDPTATFTREAPPTSSAETTVPVFGPPADQAFSSEDNISFAWVWLTSPEESEAFSVYVSAEDEQGESILVGVASEPDNASLYLLESNAGDLNISAGSYVWQVRLEDTISGDIIVESDPRRFIIIEDPTETPTTAPPTQTATSVATSTRQIIQVSATPTAAICEPEPLPRWIAHRVVLGENLSYFAERANVPVQTIFDANCLSPGAVLSVGQLLYIPPPLATDTPTPGPPTPTPFFDDGGDNGGGGGGGDDDGGGNDPDPTPKPPRPTSTPGPPPGDE